MTIRHKESIKRDCRWWNDEGEQESIPPYVDGDVRPIVGDVREDTGGGWELMRGARVCEWSYRRKIRFEKGRGRTVWTVM